MIRKIAILLFSLCLCWCCTAAGEELLIVHATDMHYLSPQLTDYGEAFMSIVEKADGKVTHYTPQLMKAFVEEMLCLMPDTVILSGDLTLNGAEQSHQELAEILLPLKKAGIQVLVLPGNHDTGTDAYRFGPEGPEVFAGMEDEKFDEMYASFGYEDAISRDRASMSYVAQLSPEVRCLLVDVNANGTYGTVQAETLVWIEEQLRRACEEKLTVIAVTHQSVLQHNRRFSFGYVINNSAALQTLFEDWHVQLNLSGHLHMQHIAGNGKLMEIAGSSLTVSPHQYGMLHMQQGRLVDYRTQPVNVEAWAVKNGETNPDLLHFASYSAAFFDRTTREPLMEMFADSAIDSAVQQKMEEFAVRVNREYFAGSGISGAEDDGLSLWLQYLPDHFFTAYLQEIVNDAAVPMNQYVFSK